MDGTPILSWRGYERVQNEVICVMVKAKICHN